ncbi:N-acetyltransferase [Acidimicrobiaceae bacterium]|nr:N-acetyltransferase [Acidimicrobiaceae bacterium]
MINEDCNIHNSVKIIEPVNIYGCTLKKDVFVGPFVEIQNDVFIDEGTRIQSHTFICSEVNLGKNCFVGHGVMFINDSFSNSTINFAGPYEQTIIEDDVIIGSNATIMPVKIVSGVIVGAGSVVTKDILEAGKYAGNPARKIS